MRAAKTFLTVIALPWLAAASALAAADHNPRVVRAGSLTALSDGSNVRVFNRDGLLVASIGNPHPATGSAVASRTQHARVDDEVLEDLNVAEADRESWFAEDLLETEQRRYIRHYNNILNDTLEISLDSHAPPVLAATWHSIWLSVAGNLWRIRTGTGTSPNPSKTALPAANITSLAPLGRDGLAAIAGHTLLRAVDGGTRWEVLADLAEPAVHLAANANGTLLAWGTRAWVSWRSAASPGERTWRSTAEILDVVVCGQHLFLLTRAGLLVATAKSSPVLVSSGVGAERLACSANGQVIAGIQPGLKISRDGGATWTSVPNAPAHGVWDAAVGEDGEVWAATTAGLRLYHLDALTAPQASDVDGVGSLSVYTREQPTPWAAWLPRLVIQGDASYRDTDRNFRLLAFADFPLGTPGPEWTPAPQPAISPPVRFPYPPTNDTCLLQARKQAASLALVEPGRARSFIERSRRAAWLPEFRIRADRRMGRSESLDVRTTSGVLTMPFGVDTVDDVRYEARATWDLAKIVFSTEELAAQASALRMADERQQIETTIHRLYFERRRLLLEASMNLEDNANSGGGARRALRIEELEADLDAFTGGAFSTCAHSQP